MITRALVYKGIRKKMHAVENGTAFDESVLEKIGREVDNLEACERFKFLRVMTKQMFKCSEDFKSSYISNVI